MRTPMRIITTRTTAALSDEPEAVCARSSPLAAIEAAREVISNLNLFQLHDVFDHSDSLNNRTSPHPKRTWGGGGLVFRRCILGAYVS